MTIIFRYKTVTRPDGSLVKTPSIPVSLTGKENFDTIALLDSGADLSAIPQGIAELLGLDLTGERKSAFGIGGKVDATDTTMAVSIEKGHERYTFRIPVKVILGDYDLPVLLGRAGFFDKFVVSFDQAKEKVLLKHNGNH